MATFQEKIDHACRAFNITVEELCIAIKINPFSLHLHATGQRELEHNEMVLLCQYFDLMGNYFTNTNIRFVDKDLLPDEIRSLMTLPEDKKGIMCYEVTSEDAPDITLEDITNILEIARTIKR